MERILTMLKSKVEVIQGSEEVTAKVLAQSIVKIADATKALYAAGLLEKTIILLISEASGVGKRDVGYVLSALYHLKSTYLAPAKGVKNGQ